MTTPCIDAFKNLFIEIKNNNVAISACCVALPTKTVSTIDFTNDPYLNKIRESWTNGEYPPACNNCKQAEEHLYESRRQGSNSWYADHELNNLDIELVKLDFWTGDICNLACVICDPHNSSTWKKELKFPVAVRKSTVNNYWKNIDMTKLRVIHFNGGEPLLSKEHVNFLEAVPDKSKVQLNYNTNGTILPSAHLLELWEKFNLVQVDISIDDVGERFEYQRYPAKWESVTQNLQWYINNSPHNCMFGTNTSVGILNHDNVDVLMLWLSQNFNTSKFTDPISHRKQLTRGIFALENAHSRANSIIDFLDKCDQRRGTKWTSVFPNLLDYLKTAK